MLAVSLSVGAAVAHAGVCDAAFMHDGGAAQFTGQGPTTLSADLAFSDVTRPGPGQCRARVQGSASFVYLGIPTGSTRLDYLMTVHGGQASFVPYGKAGEAAPRDGQFDLRMLGLFAYDQLRKGQRLPGASYRLNIGSDSPVGRQPAVTVHIGPKTVGAARAMDTPRGSQSCLPITYSRSTDPVKLSLSGLVLPIAGVRSTVTDWYCPKLGLVVRQDIAQDDGRSSVTLTQLR
ncbi:hypothetical protein [Bordetella sp. FB-8]|uniref:hypothetical protein n=1 Tax=Bordetella sp. FB-8 TaxID=1159870 RepID=UPI0003747338|nr:hypothetical protein [Bordetella sp. FB-8]